MRYVSTRGGAPALDFEAVVLTGLAEDGGLYLPETLPYWDAKALQRLRPLSYEALAVELMWPFVAPSLSKAELEALVRAAYQDFPIPKTLLKPLSEREYALELFHGPTFAFKDFALQFLGRLLPFFLERRKTKAVVLGATSGDTGSAALQACRHSAALTSFILHPHQAISPLQRKQMTTLDEKNIFNLAVQGNFDACQQLVKRCFLEQNFLQGASLIAVNSINWARILAQLVYYFKAYFDSGATAPVVFAVPTGNFGNVLAGYLAARLGLPIKKLLVVTNENDILHRFFDANDYRKQPLRRTLSPSMDIMVSSNLERLFYWLAREQHERRTATQAAATVAKWMETFEREGALRLDLSFWNQARTLFSSVCISESAALQGMRTLFEEKHYLFDPHSVLAFLGLQQYFKAGDEAGTSVGISLATAHPGKFPEVVKKAGITNFALPPQLAALEKKPERYEVIPPDLAVLKAFIAERVAA